MTYRILVLTVAAFFLAGTMAIENTVFAQSNGQPFNFLEMQIEDLRIALTDVANDLQNQIDAIKDGTVPITVDWLNIQNRPAGLDDGDDDSLSELGCTTDQIAKFDGTQWICDEFLSEIPNVYVVRAVTPAQGIQFQTVVSQCNSGDIAISGGYATTSDNAHTTFDRPIKSSTMDIGTGQTPDAWQVAFIQAAAPQNLNAYVVCLDTTP